MEKIAFFIEGQTERIFLIKFLTEYLGGEHNFSSIIAKYENENSTRIIAKRSYPYSRYFILIFDSAGDGNVIPALRERAENMVNNENYKYLIALQDLYDKPRGKKGTLIRSFKELFKTLSIRDKVKLVLAIMEIEAWFLADPNLFSKINPIATPSRILTNLGIDLRNENPESFNHPAAIINRIYGLFGSTYKKTEKQSYQIVYNIDYEFLYSDDILNKIRSWGFFINSIENHCFN